MSAHRFDFTYQIPTAVHIAQPKRNVFGLIASNADLARAGIRLRQCGQEIIEVLGARKIHPAWAVPGGVRSPLTEEGRARIRTWEVRTSSFP